LKTLVDGELGGAFSSDQVGAKHGTGSGRISMLKNEGHMPEDKFLVMSRKGKRLGVAYASTPRGEGGAGSLKFKTK
jgi:hypothetical protein